jgi:flagellar hook-associated protein 3 FlgL
MSASLFTNFSASIGLQEAQINVLEQQIASGYAVQAPSQNPAAYETATIAQNQIGALANQNATQASIQTKLASVTNAYGSVSTLYNNIQSVIEQALNGTTSPQQLQTFSTQIQSFSQQLVGLANSTAPDGSYLFGGSRSTLTPFQTNGSGQVVYLGDSGQSQAAITPTTTAGTLASGSVFVSALAGNGYAIATAGAANAGTGTLLSEGVVQAQTAASFQAGTAPITLSFATGANGLTYTAMQNGTAIATGAATDGSTIQLAGQNFQLNGTPVAGDSFTISPSRPQSAFDMLQGLSTSLSTAVNSSASKAQLTQTLSNGLATLAQYQQTLLTAQAQNGVTLQAISNAGSSNANQSTALQLTVQNAVGTDMPAAMTQLNQTITAVQAAAKAFSAVQNLSLFQYI